MRPSLRARYVGLVGHAGVEWVPVSRGGEERGRGAQAAGWELLFFLVDRDRMGGVFAGGPRRAQPFHAFGAVRKTTLPLGGDGGERGGRRKILGEPGNGA